MKRVGSKRVGSDEGSPVADGVYDGHRGTLTYQLHSPPTITYQPHANHTQEGKQQAIALITDATQAFAEMGNQPPPSSTHEELPWFHPVRALQEDGQTRPKQGGWLQTLDTRP